MTMHKENECFEVVHIIPKFVFWHLHAQTTETMCVVCWIWSPWNKLKNSSSSQWCSLVIEPSLLRHKLSSIIHWNLQYSSVDVFQWNTELLSERCALNGECTPILMAGAFSSHTDHPPGFLHSSSSILSQDWGEYQQNVFRPRSLQCCTYPLVQASTNLLQKAKNISCVRYQLKVLVSSYSVKKKKE